MFGVGVVWVFLVFLDEVDVVEYMCVFVGVFVEYFYGVGGFEVLCCED